MKRLIRASPLNHDERSGALAIAWLPTCLVFDRRTQLCT